MMWINMMNAPCAALREHGRGSKISIINTPLTPHNAELAAPCLKCSFVIIHLI